MSQFVCVEDYEIYATKHLPPAVRDYYNSGAGEQFSLRLNTEAFRKYRIRPRFLKDVSKRDLSTTILGEKISMPLGVAPSAMQRMAHPDGELANARGTTEGLYDIYNDVNCFEGKVSYNGIATMYTRRGTKHSMIPPKDVSLSRIVKRENLNTEFPFFD